jgi:hypothetical protein
MEDPMKKHVLRWLPLLVLSGNLLVGCGGATAPPTTGPDGDSRSAEEKASEDLLLKSRDANNKNSRK